MSQDREPLITITDPKHDRYASLRLIDWWNQERVEKAHVMVVGAGALGNEVLKNLALFGVGHLFIVDFDNIEASNLTRSVLYRAEDGGQPKSVIAAQRIQALNPDIQVLAFNGDVTRELGVGIYRRMDIVISCLDNRAARLAVNLACWNTKTPWVDGALDILDGLVRVFIPPDGACYECTMTSQDYRLLNMRYSCPPGFVVTIGIQPTLPTTASIIAAMQVQETMKLLHGLPVQSGQAIYYTGTGMRLNPVAYPRRKDCPAHTVYEPIITLPYSVNDLTLEQLITILGSSIQTDVTVFLPHEVVTSFYCAVCDSQEKVYQPYTAVVPAQVPCPRCGTLRTYDVTSTFATRSTEQGIPLTQLGIPALHIFPVRSDTGWQYFELSADEQYLLPNW